MYYIQPGKTKKKHVSVQLSEDQHIFYPEINRQTVQLDLLIFLIFPTEMNHRRQFFEAE